MPVLCVPGGVDPSPARPLPIAGAGPPVEANRLLLPVLLREVAQGFECGLSLENYNDVKEGDVVECYIIKQVEREFVNEPAAAGAPA